MANLCKNRLVVVGLTVKPEIVANSLERKLYGHVLPTGNYYSVVAGEGPNPTFSFMTDWDTPMNELRALSEELGAQQLLLKYSCWESGFRGQMVISDGEVVEHIHRLGYGVPGFLFTDITHPLVDLIGPYMTPKTLAQHACERLQDAIAIVTGLQQTLDDARFSQSSFQSFRDETEVIRTREQLNTLLQVMNKHASAVTFEGVLIADDRL